MIIGNKVVFKVSENYIDIALLSYKFTKRKIKKIKTIDIESNVEFNIDENVDKINTFLSENNIKDNKAIVVLELDGIITRLVEIPFMKKKEVESFVHNNIDEYFTVNIDEYYYDYKILDIDKGEEKKIYLLLVVFPKHKIDSIVLLVENCGLNLDKITIYPDCILRFFNKNWYDTTAILDISRGKINMTILEKKKLFLYSNMHLSIPESLEQNYDEILENVEYFLNFYSSRHFGNKVDKIHLIGQISQDKQIFKLIKEQFDIDVIAGIDYEMTKKVFVPPEIDINEYCDILGCDLNIPEIYNKAINFNQILKKDEEIFTRRNSIAFSVAMLALMLSGWGIGTNFYVKNNFTKYDTKVLDEQIKKIGNIDVKYKEILDTKKEYEKKQETIKKIKQDELKYLEYLERIRKGLPSDVYVRNIYVDKDKVDLVVNINKSTLDKVKLVIAINNIGIFEHVELDSIKLNDSENEAKFTLIIKEPL
ncbi:pilus assembly protein PilM [Haloimpatiens sp. FM7330]|uniref:pilus assembly protein PilM n=1 Tax=Haloimpatiens sp. FM7330 TaxID=3298610 RepID=UPI0036364922